MTTRDDSPIDWLGFLREPSSNGESPKPWVDEWEPRIKEVILAAERHRRDPTRPLVKFGRFEHGDLKPANVLVTLDGQVRVADFGIGRLLLEQEPEAIREPRRELGE